MPSGNKSGIVVQGLPDSVPIEVRQLDFIINYAIKYRMGGNRAELWD